MRHPVASWLLLTSWAAAIIVGLWVYSLGQVHPFDPDLRLSQAAAQPGFDAQIVQLLTASGVPPGSLVHLESGQTCFCNRLAESHFTVLSSQLQEQGYQPQRLSLEMLPQLARLIPSVPALAVLGPDSQLRYLGPYATGYGCFTGQNLLTTISQLALQTPLAGAVINSDASGCFCPS